MASKSSMHDIYELTKHYDLIFLQEIWLFTYELSILSTINSEFESFSLSAIDDSNGIVQGRPYGGIGILMRKSY